LREDSLFPHHLRFLQDNRKAEAKMNNTSSQRIIGTPSIGVCACSPLLAGGRGVNASRRLLYQQSSLTGHCHVSCQNRRGPASGQTGHRPAPMYLDTEPTISKREKHLLEHGQHRKGENMATNKWVGPAIVWGHKTVEAESFVLRSSDGKIRAALSTSSDSTALMMEDGKGTSRIFVSIGADGAPSLAMADASGTDRIFVSLPNGTPSLGMYDADKKLRAMLGFDPSGTPALTLYDAEQKLRAKFDH
jgi:hypothetical protein